MRHRVTTILLIVLTLTTLASTATAQRTATLPWWERAAEAKIGEYWIKTDLPAREANAWGRHLNVMYREYARRLASLPPRAPEVLHVLIFARQADYVRVMRTRYGINATGTGGMFFVTAHGRGLAMFTEGLAPRRIEHVIQHEGFHQFAWSRFGGDLPIWVNEGLAEFFGQSVFVNDKLILGQNQKRVLDAVKTAIENGEHIPFRRMLTMTAEAWGSALQSGNAGLQYNQAWSMVHFLVYGDGGRYTEHFERYLRLLNAGVESESAFITVFGDDIDAFERRWIAYATQAKPSAFLTAMERLDFLAAGLLMLSEHGRYPETLADLRRELQAADFSLNLDRHGLAVTLDADDEALYQIPRDDLSEDLPLFELERKSRRRVSRRERLLEEENPTPALIRTQNLKPRTLRLRWVRDQDRNTFTYHIDVN